MTKANLFGSALIGAAMALTGCAGGATSVETSTLESAVPASVDGRTDLFLDATLAPGLLTADEVNGSPTAIAVEVQLTDSELIAWRAQPSVAAADRSRTAGDIVGRFRIVGVDLSTAVAIDNETHTGGPGETVVPGTQLGGFRGGRNTGSSESHPPLTTTPHTQFTIDWTNLNGIPSSVDAELIENLANAHPGCA